jgi:hypothetical protein
VVGQKDKPTKNLNFCFIIKIFDLIIVLSVQDIVTAFFVAPAKKTISFF